MFYGDVINKVQIRDI